MSAVICAASPGAYMDSNWKTALAIQERLLHLLANYSNQDWSTDFNRETDPIDYHFYTSNALGTAVRDKQCCVASLYSAWEAVLEDWWHSVCRLHTTQSCNLQSVAKHHQKGTAISDSPIMVITFVILYHTHTPLGYIIYTEHNSDTGKTMC